jgi:uncharacterized cofD-like protein
LKSETRRSIVCLGGGGGSPRLLRALHRRLPTARFTAIVPCTDTGRSTGIVRQALNIPAPGDLRHCLSTLAEGRSPWTAVLEQRLSAPGHPDLDGMALGNLVLGAISQQSGNLGEAGLLLAQLLGVDIPVLPVSVENIHLGAILADGTIVHGEVAVRQPGKPPIRELFIEGEQLGLWQPTREALAQARAIVLGPGSLWTSLGAILTVRGVREAIASSGARTIFVCNTTTQPGQTDSLDVVGHVVVISQLLGRSPDVVLINTGQPAPTLRDALARDGLYLLEPTPESIARIESLGTSVLLADLLAPAQARPSLWQKLDTAYHDMERTAAILQPLLDASPQEAVRVEQ